MLRAEITRLARREARSEVETLRAASRHHRAQIAALKDQVAQLQRGLKTLLKAGARAPRETTADDEGTPRRFSADRLARHREKLGLSAASYGQLVGVSALSIYKWESGTVRPRAAQLASLASVRGLSKRAALERLGQG